MTGAAAAVGPSGAAIIAALKRADVRHVAALPDIVTSEGLLWPLARDRDLRLIRLSREDEGVGICAGLAACGKRAVLLMQDSGFFDSLNAIRVIAMEFEQPICMVVGIVGGAPGVLPHQSAMYAARVIEPVIDAMGIDRLLIDEAGEETLIAPAISRAYEKSRALVALIGQAIEP
jgi:sulfopyruvate decarboxylase subunit alpha